MSDTRQCKDYFILKVRIYADKYILDKFGPSHPQHIERADESWNFFWKLVEKSTNKPVEYWYDNYRFFPADCALEELEESFGITRFRIRDAYYIYIIPKQHTEIIEWIKSKLKPHYKILKKTFIGFYDKNKDLKCQRAADKIRTEEFNKKILIRESTRNTLIEKNNKS